MPRILFLCRCNSVLGDLTGDGNVNTLDITFMRRIAKGEVDFDSLKVEFLLAAF
mgnify:CR=1 FL=1